ncbi:MAG: response regulator [Planctomycetota bacterium]|jgi:CheY-like chemotaxis protein|nr:response regulator [Planctomycetota bacterium]
MPEPTSQSKPSTVLVVDDNPAVLEIASDVLREAGHSVITAADGEQGVALFAKQNGSLHLVLLDVVLPGLHGSEVLRECQRINRAVPVVIMSGFVRDTGIDELIAEGAKDFIAKPFEIADLAAIVAKHSRS